MAKAKKESILELPVAYGGVSIGDTTARIGLKVSRGNITVNAADKQLTCKRLNCKIIACSNGAQAGSPVIPGMEGSDYVVEGSADCKGVSANGKSISFGLTFNLEQIDIESLSHFAKHEGRLEIDGAEDLTDEEAEEEES